jgi:hypothetical protein
MTISLPNGLMDKYYEACDFFLNNDIIGRDCTIIYPPKRTACTNCVVKPVGSTTTNVYRDGGPAPFNFNSCPLCGGNGYKETEVTDTIRLRIYWEKSQWIKIGGAFNIDDAEAMIIGFMADVPKITRAIEILLVKDQTEAVYRATLLGKPYPHGFGRSRYFMAYLKGN